MHLIERLAGTKIGLPDAVPRFLVPNHLPEILRDFPITIAS